MGLFFELRARARHVVGPVLGICVVGYFVYHAFQGERGIIAWHRLERQVADARALKAEIEATRTTLERRVGHLSPGSLDPDMLDERVRLMLNYADSDDIVVLVPPGRRTP